MSSYLLAPQLARPTPVHAQTVAAEEAREAIRRYAWRRRHDREAKSIVTAHDTPHVEPFADDVVTAGARRLLAVAETRGMRTNLIELADRCVVEGIDPSRGVAFRATWRRGRALTGTWHERERRYEMQHDDRPGPDAKVKRTVKGKTTWVADPNRMPYGLDRDHMRQVGGPEGVSVGVQEVEKRVRALESAP